MTNNIKACVFDLGGVVVSSPFPGIVAYEKQIGATGQELGKLLEYSNNNGLFAKLERNEITFDEYCKGAEQMFLKNYLGDDIVPFSGRDFVESIEEVCSKTDAKIIAAVDKLREHGVLCAVITNNWYNTTLQNVLPTHEEMFSSTPIEHQKHMKELMELFDFFFESRALGKRKPEVALYKHALAELSKKAGVEIQPNQVVFVDDIGSNLKPMKELGVHTILAKGTEQVLHDVEQIVKIPLH